VTSSARLPVLLLVLAGGCAEQSGPSVTNQANYASDIVEPDGLATPDVVADAGPEPRPVITVLVGSAGAAVVKAELAAVVPVAIRNVGDAPLTVSGIELTSPNADGTTPNAHVTIDWGAFDPATGLPHVIKPGVANTTIDIKVRYDVAAQDPNKATLRITSDDPTRPQADVVFTPPPSE